MPRFAKPTIEKAPQEPRRSSRVLKGFRDILPKEQKYWNLIYDTFFKLASEYGFERIETPILEETSLFVRSVGRQTDIVSKEMFSFTDAGGSNISLRPEATASIARSFIDNGMQTLPQPVKLSYWGPMFRRERPQAGRYRQFWQFGLEVLGTDAAVIDAQLIAFISEFCTSIGLEDIVIQVNSNGCKGCREEYIQELVAYYKQQRKNLCDDCKKRLTRNPLRLLDCKQPTCKELIDKAPQILDWLDDDCKNHFMSVLEFLDGLEISYVLNPYLVRGLDYYTQTVFEVFPADKEQQSQSAIAGGGRYSGLVEKLGGQEASASGFSAGIERIVLALKEKGGVVDAKKTPNIFLAQIGEQAKLKSLKLFEKLRKNGFSVAENFSKDGLKSQLEMSNNLNVKYSLIIGQKEVLDGTILVRDMESGVQEVVDYEKVLDDLKKKMEKNGNS